MAIQTLEGGAADAAPQSRKLLVAALASAGKPGAPRDALPITLRGIGFSHASIGALDAAAAAYARALAEAKRRAPTRTRSLAAGATWRSCAASEGSTPRRRPAGTRRRRRCGRRRRRPPPHTPGKRAAAAAAAAAGGGGGANGGGAVAREAEAARMELQLCRADCLRDQQRYEESEALIVETLKWREKHLGPSDPATLAAVYDLSCCRRTRSLAHASAAAGHAAAGPLGSADEPSDARGVRVAAIDALPGVAPDLDERWQGGLRGLVAGEPASRFAEHATMLASVAQLHKNHAEAAMLFRLVIDEYDKQERAAADATGSDAAAGGGAAAGGAGAGAPLGDVEKAELFNRSARASSRRATTRRPRRCSPTRSASSRRPRRRRRRRLRRSRPTRRGSSRRRATPPAPPRCLTRRARRRTSATKAALQLAATSGDSSTLVRVHILHARVLSLYAAYCKEHGRQAEGEEMAATVKHLESTYGFSSQ